MKKEEYRVINGTPVAKNFDNLYDWFSTVQTFTRVQKHNLQYCNIGSVLHTEYYEKLNDIEKSIEVLLHSIENDRKSGQIE